MYIAPLTVLVAVSVVVFRENATNKVSTTVLTTTLISNDRRFIRPMCIKWQYMPVWRLHSRPCPYKLSASEVQVCELESVEQSSSSFSLPNLESNLTGPI